MKNLLEIRELLKEAEKEAYDLSREALASDMFLDDMGVSTENENFIVEVRFDLYPETNGSYTATVNEIIVIGDDRTFSIANPSKYTIELTGFESWEVDQIKDVEYFTNF